MTWLISLLIAGTMLAAENNLPVQTNQNYTETKAVTTVKNGAADETERFEKTYPLTANGRVSVSNVNGSITVEGWDRNEVKLEYVKTADTKEHLSDVQVKINAQNDSLDVEAEYDYEWSRNGGNNNWKSRNSKVEVEFRLMVPRGAMLNEIETVNGSVNVANVTNTTKVSAVNGEVKATNLRGTAELSTVNGTVTADYDRLDNTNQIRLETVNGQAFLTVPSDTNATVRAESVNGKITNDFGLPVRKGQYVGRSLYGKIGSGEVKIKLESVNGELSLRRKQDGKNPNPATNLLNMKSEDDDDEDDDAKVLKMDRDVKRSIAEASKVKVKIPEMKVEVRQAMELAQKEIAAVQVNQVQMQQAMQQAREAQRAAMAQMREGGWFVGSPSVERKSESFAVKGIPKVTIDATNCAVSVRGWDKAEVQYTVTRVTRSNTQSVTKYSITHSDSEVNIGIGENNSAPGDDFGGNTRIRVEVFVPHKSNLKIITNREVRLENVSGELDVQGGEEAVDVRDSDGSLNVSTCVGKIRVIGFSGALDAKNEDGLMSLEGDFQKFSARTAGGTIILTLPENANADIESNLKDIVGEGFSLDYQGDGQATSKWKIGNGGANYLLYSTADGKVVVRNANLLSSN